MKKEYSSVFMLSMMNVAVIMSLRGLPIMAQEGLGLVFYLLFSAIVFLIPTALVSAELATGWSKGGGVYEWVKAAFGNRAGFVAIWLQWVQNVIWYPTVLAFAAGAMAYLFLSPELAENKLFNVCMILGIYWGATLLNFRGIKTSGWFTTAGVVGGTIFPGALIIVLGLVWVLKGKPIAIDTSMGLFPDLKNISSLAFLAGIVLLFAGMEVSAVHAREVKDPKTDYPKAILLSTVIIITVFLLGALAVSFVIPKDQINLTAGVMQTFSRILSEFHLSPILPILGGLVAFGTIGGVTAWIIGPSKGLLRTAEEGNLPKLLSRTNKKNVPEGILWIQGAIVTTITFVYLFMPTVSSAFFLLTDLTAMLYLIMYLLLFTAAIRLRYSQPNVKRTFVVPGGKPGMWFVSGLAILGIIFAVVVSLVPPEELAIGTPLFYTLFLLLGLAIAITIPLVILKSEGK